MTTITDVKLAMISILSTYWDESPPPSCPTKANIQFGTRPRDAPKRDDVAAKPSVIIGRVERGPVEWLSGKDKLFKPVLNVHTFVRIPEGSGTSFNEAKKVRDAMNQNIRTIGINHPDRPVPDIMHVWDVGAALDVDDEEARPIILQSITPVEIWYVETYL